MNSNKIPQRTVYLAILGLCGALILLAACTVNPTPTPIHFPPPTPTPTPIPSTFLVSILNKRLTHAEIADAIKREGSVNVSSWSYTAANTMTQQFQNWVQQEYAVKIQVQYSSILSTTLQTIYTAEQSNTPAPFDVIAADESNFVEAQSKNAVAQMLPSDLLSNVSRLDPSLVQSPYAVAFQSSATIAPIFHNDTVGAWFHDWQDLADPRLKRRITLPKPGDIIAGGFLLGVANSLNKDYKNPQQMHDAIDFVCTQIVPNIYTVTSNLNQQQQLLRENRVDVAVNWNLLARLEGFSGAAGTEDIRFRPMTSGQPALNGYAWIPQGTPHPVLAQLWLNWRLSDAAQLPDDTWQLSKPAWGEYHEGLLGASYQQNIPVWLSSTYNNYYPTTQQMQDLYKPIDWIYYAAHNAEWMEQYSQCVQ